MLTFTILVIKMGKFKRYLFKNNISSNVNVFSKIKFEKSDIVLHFCRLLQYLKRSPLDSHFFCVLVLCVLF